MSHLATNLRRLMARHDLTLDNVVTKTGLDERTIKAILAGTNKPHARTLHRLAAGLDAPTDELFQDPSLLAHRLFDRVTNPIVDELVTARPELFEGWTENDFDELYSRFGTGGGLTMPGAAEVVAAMNRKRDVHHKLALLMESAEADLIAGLVELLYQKIAIRPDRDGN